MRRLLIRPGGIGDSILCFPALECLKADYTEAWVREDVAPLIQFADSVRPIASTGIDLLGLDGIQPPRPLIETLRRFDSIVSWYGSNRAEFRSAVEELKLPFQFLDALPEPHGSVHAVDFFLKQAACIPGAIPRINCGRIAAGDFAMIHPFSGSRRKNWPLEKFRELATQLNMPVRWCAGAEESLDDAERFTDLYKLACLLASSRIYIGNDSGITHLAAAAGARVIAIFGPTDPIVWAPRGERVAVVSGALGALTVGQVSNAVHMLLKE